MPTAPSPSVIAALQSSVALHLTAIEHYTAMSEHLDRIGYTKLANRFRSDVDEERGHLRAVQARLEFYGEQPTYQHDEPTWPRYNVPGMIQASLDLEATAAGVERQNVTTARAAGDELSAVAFAELLESSEGSIRELEADQLTLAQVGADNWLANQL